MTSVTSLLTDGLTHLIQNEQGYATWTAANIQAFVAFLLSYESFMVKAMRICAYTLSNGAQQVLFPTNMSQALKDYFSVNPFQDINAEVVDLAHFLCKARYLQDAIITSDATLLPTATLNTVVTFSGSEQADYYVAQKIADAFTTLNDSTALAYFVYSSKTLAHKSLIDFDLPFLASIKG